MITTAVLTAGAVGIGAGPAAATDAPAVPQNYVTAFGTAPALAPADGLSLNQPIVALAATKSGHGYWLASGDGGVFTFGDAAFAGSRGGARLNQPMVALAVTKSGHGYWLAAADGGIFTFGDAPFLGSLGGTHLAAPIVALAATPTGHGYWLAAADGGIFTFGDAPFAGSLGGTHLAAPIVALAATPTGHGYWLAAADGGIFTFGDARFLGSTATTAASAPTVAMAAIAGGYWLATGATYAPAGAGAAGPNVARIQNRLRNLGYWLGDEQTRFGPLTAQAVLAFQKVEGLARTSAVDGATAARLPGATRPAPGGPGDMIEIDKSRQVLFIVRGGAVALTFNTSTGSDQVFFSQGRRAVAHTPEGRFQLLRQVDGSDKSPLGVLWRPKYFTTAGHAIHGYTSVPAFPASHGCVRVSMAAMDFLWSSGLAPLGETVWVH